MNHSSLFDPITIGSVRLKNRLYMAPIHAGLANGSKADPDERLIKFYEERARGGVGLIITGHVKAERRIDPYPHSYGLYLDDRRTLKAFRELTEAIHAHGAKIAVELSVGAGRIADTVVEGFVPASPSPTPLLYYPKIKTRELSKDEITSLVKAYGIAARNAKEAGFDFVLVHAMAYLFDQFLTPAWNQRTDEYGGSLENRLRFLMECIDSVRNHTGHSYPLIVSLSMDDGVKSGKSEQDVVEIAKALEAKGVAALHVRNGCYDRMDKFITSYLGARPQCIDLAAKVKAAVTIPILSDGSLLTPEACEHAIKEGQIDMAGLGRPLITDPAWPIKAMTGSSETIRPCLRCMECLTRVGAGWHIGCSVNPLAGREDTQLRVKAAERKTVLVIGSGLSGILAALHARERGHNVVLADEGTRLGGRLRTAALPEFKLDTKRYLEYLVRKLDQSGVELQLGTSAILELIEKLRPQEIIMAAETVDALPAVPGSSDANVFLANDALENPEEIGQRVVVVGSGIVGCETALSLAHSGRSVTLVDSLPKIGKNIIYFVRVEMLNALAESNVNLMPNTQLTSVFEGGITARTPDGETKIEADSIIFATGQKQENPLWKAVAKEFPTVRAIGDASGTYGYMDAAREAFAIASAI